jgi:hypothetical protein
MSTDAGGSVPTTMEQNDMASDDQGRDAAGNDHAMGLKPEFRALAERAKELAKREERRRTEQMKADTQKKAESTKAEQRRIAENRRQEEKKRAERRQESLRKEAERRIENGKSVVEKERARRQFNRQADDRNKAQAPIAEKDKSNELAADRRRAAAAVAERQQRQKVQQQEEHRRQTDHMRTLHHGEMHSFKENEDAAIAGHAHEIESINEREQQALAALGVHRESLMGRAVTFFKGEAHYAREAEAIVDRCEAERMATHRDLEALKERQFAAAQQARLRHAQERKGIAELHRMERQQLVQAHERSRGSEMGVSQRAFERAADRKEQTLEQVLGLCRGPSR